MTNEEAIAEFEKGRRLNIELASELMGEWRDRHLRSAELCRLAIAALEATRWRSMETAPRDTPVDVAFGNGTIAVGVMTTFGGKYASTWQLFPKDVQLLGWRPRPEPPKERVQ